MFTRAKPFILTQIPTGTRVREVVHEPPNEYIAEALQYCWEKFPQLVKEKTIHHPYGKTRVLPAISLSFAMCTLFIMVKLIEILVLGKQSVSPK